MDHLITEASVHDFKTKFCNENSIIAHILREKVSSYILEPILDVGSGLGDITAAAFPDKRVIHLDTIDFSMHPLPATHVRVQGDFFNFFPKEPVNTVLMSHVLQYLDQDHSCPVNFFPSIKIALH